MMKLAVLKYDNNGNIGDEIQTLAVEQFLPQVDVRLDREMLASAQQGEKTLLLMNGWFANHPLKSFPPATNIEPIFFSFHISDRTKDWTHFFSNDSLAYFRKYQPIGCRDQKTAERLRAVGLDAYYTKCLTLTFPKRSVTPRDGKVFIVDIDERCVHIPREIRRGAHRLTHIVCGLYDDELKRAFARKTLELYRDNAKLIITSRIHCALPCAAMGIPVVFFGDPSSNRVSLLTDIGIKIHPYRKFRYSFQRYFYKLFFHMFRERKINWNPAPVDLDREKSTIIAKVKKLLLSQGLAGMLSIINWDNLILIDNCYQCL